jgi:Protein of unknown function (DUF2829)
MTTSIVSQGIDFGHALAAVKEGKRISRAGWNGKGMFVFQRPGDKLPFSVIAQVKSLPQSVKSFLLDLPHEQGVVEFLPYLCMWSATSEVVNGWLASQSDMQATDWCVLD